MSRALTFEKGDPFSLSFMFWNDEDLFEAAFNDERIREEALRDIERERVRIAAMPIMLKARQIGRLVSYICETLPSEDLAHHYREIMQSDAGIITGKVAAAEGCAVYSVKMENAVLIKLAAKNLLSQMSGLRMLGYSDPRYIRLLCDEIEEFRALFVDWITTFDRRSDMRDGWGVFH